MKPLIDLESIIALAESEVVNQVVERVFKMLQSDRFADWYETRFLVWKRQDAKEMLKTFKTDSAILVANLIQRDLREMLHL